MYIQSPLDKFQAKSLACFFFHPKVSSLHIYVKIYHIIIIITPVLLENIDKTEKKQTTLQLIFFISFVSRLDQIRSDQIRDINTQITYLTGGKQGNIMDKA